MTGSVWSGSGEYSPPGLQMDTLSLCLHMADNRSEPSWFSQWSCVDVRIGVQRKLRAEELMLLNCGVGEDSCESLGLQGDPTSPIRSVLGVHWKDWCWSWNSNTLATWCEELTHWKRHWSWERLRAGREGFDRGWDGWMASPTQWTWVWISSGGWWWTGRPGLVQSMGVQRIGHNWAAEQDWTEKLQHQGTIFTLSSKPNYLPEVPSLKIITLRSGLQYLDSGGHNSIHSIS